MKSSLALALLIINICGTGLLLGLVPPTMPYTPRTPQNETIPNSTNSTNLSQIEKDTQFSSEKKLRKLSQGDEMFVVLLLDLVTLLVSFIIMFSFCVGENECCAENSQRDICCGLCVGSCFYQCCCSPRCRLDSQDGGSLALLLIICLLTFCAVKACGKHVSRYIGFTINMILFFVIFNLTNISYSDNPEEPSLMVSIICVSGSVTVINFLGLFLPCFSSCRYEELPLREPMVNPSAQVGIPSQVTPQYNQPQNLAYIPPSSGISNVPAYPPNNTAYPPGPTGYDSSQGNIYVNPQFDYGVPPPTPLQPM